MLSWHSHLIVGCVPHKHDRQSWVRAKCFRALVVAGHFGFQSHGNLLADRQHDVVYSPHWCPSKLGLTCQNERYRPKRRTSGQRIACGCLLEQVLPLVLSCAGPRHDPRTSCTEEVHIQQWRRHTIVVFHKRGFSKMLGVLWAFFQAFRKFVRCLCSVAAGSNVFKAFEAGH